MTYEEFEKCMIDFCNKRHEAWIVSDWKLDEDLERKMIKLEKENPEFSDRWFNEVFIKNSNTLSLSNNN